MRATGRCKVLRGGDARTVAAAVREEHVVRLAGYGAYFIRGKSVGDVATVRVCQHAPHILTPQLEKLGREYRRLLHAESHVHHYVVVV